jgi:acetyl esterase
MMMLDPDLARFLAFWAKSWSSLPATSGWQEQRAFHEKLADELLDPALRDVPERLVFVPFGDRTVPVGLFDGAPETQGPKPCLVYMHGGGWVRGSSTTNRYVTAALARANRQIVASVDYSLAPEHQYPVAVEESIAAARWIFDEARALGIAPQAISVGGDSAGGNLATAVALALRGSSHKLIAQWLVYPVTDFDTTHPSYTELADIPGLLRTKMDEYSALYCPRGEDRAQELAAPLLATSHRDLPPAFIGVGENDILRDCGAAYARALEAAGVEVIFDPGVGLAHGYMLAADSCAPAREARDKGFQWLAAQNAKAMGRA